MHCAAIGHPIVGDQTYGSSPKWLKDYGIDRPLLHAERVELEHPVSHKKIHFEAPWPADMKRALKLFRGPVKAAVIAAVLMLGAASVRADDSASSAPAKPVAAHSSNGTAGRPTGPQTSNSIKSLKKEMASLHDQFKSLIEEVSALQDRVTGIQSSMDELDASRRLHDLEKAISDLNGKAVNGSNVAEETKSQVLDLSHKLKAQQDLLDQLRDQADHLQELIEAKTHAEDGATPQAPPSSPSTKP